MKKRLALALVLATVLSLVTFPVGAANPTVSITVTAQVVSITNSQATWTIGVVTLDDVKYFSADNLEDVDYSQIQNTGSVAVDVEIQGTDFVASNVTFNWELAAAAGSETYSLYAYNVTAADYTIAVDDESYNDICVDLAKDATYDWSMKFTAPSAFNANDDGTAKSATVTLVASKHV